MAVKVCGSEILERVLVPAKSAVRPSEMLTVKEIAERLRVPSSWVYSHAKDLGAYRLGKYLRFTWDRVLEHLDRETNWLGSQPNDPVEKS